MCTNEQTLFCTCCRKMHEVSYIKIWGYELFNTAQFKTIQSWSFATDGNLASSIILLCSFLYVWAGGVAGFQHLVTRAVVEFG
jgi:hypothetical protein